MSRTTNTLDQFQHLPDHFCVDNIGHPAHAKSGIHPLADKLHVLTMVENPMRWRSRYWNYQAFESQCNNAGAILYTAEVAFGKRHFEITDPNNPHHLQLRTNVECWHKENSQNLLMAILPPEAQYILCCDSDILFARSDWAQEIMHQLQHYDLVQAFSHLIDVGPDYQPVNESSAAGFVYLRSKETTRQRAQSEHRKHHKRHKHCYDYGDQSGRGSWGCPGGAWAYRRSALGTLGQLLDWLIVGSADWYMAKALYGEIEDVLRPDFSNAYLEFSRAWQQGALRLDQNIGYVPGLVLHQWHGPKAKRGYELRPDMTARTHFDPLVDIKRDVQGLYELTSTNLPLRDALRHTARLRNEDATEV